MRSRLILISHLAYLFVGSKAATANPEAIWQTIQPSSTLSWVPCYTSGLECTRFLVPLDYTNPTNATMAIALVRIPAAVPANDTAYRGPVIVNPGGPGGSGIDTVMESGPLLQEILGDQFDIIGFDPRGIGRTTPRLRGFTSTEELMTYSIKLQQDPPLGSTPDSVARAYARAVSYGAVAESRLKEIGPYLGTPMVARDMLAISKAAGSEKLHYWGFSYGTTIGQTFASMFPQNVGRVVLDGVMDALDYYAGGYRTFLTDTDKVMDYFYEKCVLAGPLQCAIFEKTPQAVKARVDKIWDNIKREPVPVVVGTGAGDYGIVDYGLARNTIFNILYAPFLVGGQNISRLFASLEKGDGSLFFENADAPTNLQCSCDESMEQDDEADLSLRAISCSDALQNNDTVADLNAWYGANKKESTFADVLTVRVECAGWKIRSAEPFAGAQIGANTSFPILFIGNTADPVTPLANAQNMSKRFPGSAVLTLDTPGHTSGFVTSNCRALAVRAYFQNGTLPRPGMVCGIDDMLFGSGSTAALMRRGQDMASGRIGMKKMKARRLDWF